jgi:hypothetical protein
MSGDWEDGPFEELASELRRQVGREFREEAEELERDAAQLALRRRTLADVAFDAMSRGDVVTISGAGGRHRGRVVYSAGNLAVMETADSVVNVNLEGPIAWQITERSRVGGVGRSPGSLTFRARMMELELAKEEITVEASGLADRLTGNLYGVGRDHVVVVDREGEEWFIPLATVAFALQPLRPRRPR